jgi:hypothetical protein
MNRHRKTTIRRPLSMTPAEFDRALQAGAELKFKAEFSTYYGLFTFTQTNDTAWITPNDALFYFVPGLHSTDAALCGIVDMVLDAIWEVKS